MLIITDFDDTMFNTGALQRSLSSILKQFKIDQKRFEENVKFSEGERKRRDVDYRLWKFLQEQGVKDEELKVVFDSIISNTRQFLFPDAMRFLEKYQKAALVLLTFGTKQFQQIKIKGSNVSKYYDEIIVTKSEDKVEDIRSVMEKYNRRTVFFVEDVAWTVDSVEKYLPEVKTIQVKRSEGRYRRFKSKYCDNIAGNLDVVDEIIQGYIDESGIKAME